VGAHAPFGAQDGVVERIKPDSSGSGAGVTNENTAMLRVGVFDAKGVFKSSLL